MSWNPLSNGRLASGTADIPACLKAGIRVGMGVDGEASADVADPFENMRSGLYAIRDKYEDATIMSPYDVLRMHTMGSADVLGVADRLGSLEPGKFADFLMVDPTRFRTVFNPYASLVFVAGERDLERVYVGGDLLVQNGALLKQDMANRHTSYQQQIGDIQGRMATPAKAAGGATGASGGVASGGFTLPAGAPTAKGPGGHQIAYVGGKWVDAKTGAPLQ